MTTSWLICFLCILAYLDGGIGTKDELVEIISGHLIPLRVNYLQSPFIDLRPDEISTYNRPLIFIRQHKRYIPEFSNYHPERQNTSSKETSGSVDNKEVIQNAVTENLKSVIWEMKTNIEHLYSRQDLIFSYLKCSNQYNYRCKGLENVLSELEPLNWNHFLPPEIQKNTELSSSDFFQNKNNDNDREYINIVLDTFKIAIQEQTARQNLFYKYFSCSVTPRNSCSASVIPALKEAFKDVPSEEASAYEEERPQRRPLGNIFPNNPFFNIPGWAGQFTQPISPDQQNNAGIYQQPTNNVNSNSNLEQPILTGNNRETTTKIEDKLVDTKTDEDDISGLISEVWPETQGKYLASI